MVGETGRVVQAVHQEINILGSIQRHVCMHVYCDNLSLSTDDKNVMYPVSTLHQMTILVMISFFSQFFRQMMIPHKQETNVTKIFFLQLGGKTLPPYLNIRFAFNSIRLLHLPAKGVKTKLWVTIWCYNPQLHFLSTISNSPNYKNIYIFYTHFSCLNACLHSDSSVIDAVQLSNYMLFTYISDLL